MGLYAHGYEHENCFDEAVRMHVTLASARVMLDCLSQRELCVDEKYEQLESYMFSDNLEATTRGKSTELLHNIIGIFDRHGGPHLRDHPFSKHHSDSHRSTNTEYAKMAHCKKWRFQKEEIKFEQGMDS